MELRSVTNLPQANPTDTAQPRSATTPEGGQVPDTIVDIGVSALLKALVNKTSVLLTEQNTLLELLPPQIKAVVQQILQANLPETADVSTGLSTLLSSRRMTLEALSQLADQLQFAATVAESADESTRTDLQAVIEKFGPNAAKLANQLTINQPLQLNQALSEQVQSLASEIQQQTADIPEQKEIVKQISQAAAQTAPANIQQTAQQLNLPGLPLIWALAKQYAEPQQPQEVVSNLQEQTAKQQPDTAQLPGASPVKLPGADADANPPAGQAGLTLPPEEHLPEVSSQAKQLPLALPDDALPAKPPTESANPSATMPAKPATAAEVPDTPDSPLPGQQNTVVKSAQETVAAELRTMVERFGEKAANLFTQITANQPALLESDVLEQVRQLIQEALPDELGNNPERLSTLRRTLDPALQALPQAVRQAAEQLDLPELKEVWFLAKQEETAYTPDKPASLLEQSATIVRGLAESVSRAFQTSGDNQGQGQIFTLQLPLMYGEAAQMQPVHLHVYREKQQSANDTENDVPDTWIRLTLQPEYAGPVEAIFHLYADSILDIKVVFADKNASQLFNENLSEIRKACAELPFSLRDLSVI